MSAPCICQPTGPANPAGAVMRRAWCHRCGALYPAGQRGVCPPCQAHGVPGDIALREADVIVRTVQP